MKLECGRTRQRRTANSIRRVDMQTMQLEWNFGGWFGSQLGGTVWILIAAAISLGHDVSTGVILILFFLVPNIAGLILWSRRKLTCYQSIQIVLALSGIFGLLAIYILERSKLWLEIQKGGAISAETGYLLLVIIVLTVMAGLHLKFGEKSS